MSVLPALLPAAAGGRAASGPTGGLEGGVPPAEGRRLQAAAGPSLPSHRGDCKSMMLIWPLSLYVGIFFFKFSLSLLAVSEAFNAVRAARGRWLCIAGRGLSGT